MKIISTTLFVSFLMLSAAACKKKEGDKASGGAAADKKPTSGETAAPAPAKLAYKKLGELGLEAEVPEGAEITDNTKGAGFPSATIYASPTTFVSGAGDMSDLKPTIEETKKELEKDPNKLKSWTKEEKSADGWLLEGERESMSGGKLFAIEMRKTIDGKPWNCGTNASSEAEREVAKKLCTSLRAAK
jgi:hypothetical protein